MRLRLHPTAWRGGGAALRFIGWFLAIVLPLAIALRHFAWERSLGLAAASVSVVLIALIALALVRLFRSGPIDFWWGALLASATFAGTYALSLPLKGFVVFLGLVIFSAMSFGGGLAMLRTHGFTWRRAVATAVGGLVLLTIAVALLIPGWSERETWIWKPQRAAQLDLPNPAQRGSFTVHTLTYGGGADPQRPEYGPKVDIRTEPVDGSLLIDGWSGPAGWARTKYWGVDAKHLPRQGRVWFPDGRGPFPLVLIVHGNHDMEAFSDTGYAYLGELFASRGIICVSVDENFLNSSFADLLGGFKGGLKKENDARGWLLLEHLKLWRQWNLDPQSRFFGNVDMNHIALIGHSRGGEAVAIAALFNTLPYFPDDARVQFDYGFALRGVVAIAPSDGQYEPRGEQTNLTDVNYLVIQGSRDGDVQSFMGSSQYSRIDFDTCADCFKAGFYLIGANHGQFNTAWGRDDLGDAAGALLNLAPIMDADAQRRVAEVMFGAFFEVVLREHDAYRAFLANPATGLAWLGPDIAFINQFSAADEVPIANFEEDDDLTTGSSPGVKITAVDLARWHEVQVPLKWNDLDTNAALIGWNRTDDAVVPELRIDVAHAQLPDGHLAFSLAMADDSPLDEDATWKAPDSIDFHVVVTDRSGHEAAVALSSVQPLYPQIAGTPRKLAILDGEEPSEAIFQRYTIPFDAFAGVDPKQLATIRIRFDATPAGALYLDDVAAGPHAPQ
jgi:hypothetical protein